MTRAAAWSAPEFEILLQSPALSDAEVAAQLPQRTVSAVGWVRSGIHNFHRGRDTSMLSKIMLQRLGSDRSWICPRCGFRASSSTSSPGETPTADSRPPAIAYDRRDEPRSNIAETILRFGKQITPRELFPVLVPEAADLALGNPYAFALATCLDRGTKADIIWTIPYFIMQDLGHLDHLSILKMSHGELHDLYNRLPYKPRYVDAAPRTTQELTRMVVYRFNGDASLMWRGKSAAEVKRIFRNIYGVGEQISNMAVLLIERAFGLRFSDLDRPHMDIKADVHTRRVLFRLGTSPSQSESDTIQTARRLHPPYPGELDAPLWIVGRRWCHYSTPQCPRCPLETVCAKKGVRR